jgi:hypothetical protein
LKDDAPSNILAMVVTRDTSQGLMSLLNEVAFANVLAVESTFDTSQALMSILKALALLNNLDNDVSRETFHELIF